MQIYTPPPKADIVRKNLRRELPCVLDEPDLINHARAAAKKRRELADHDDRVALERKAKKEEREKIARELARLDAIVETGKEHRVVACHERWNNGTVELVREDTGEVADVRRPTPEDRQVDAIDGGILKRAATKQRAAARRASDDGVGTVRADDGTKIGEAVRTSVGDTAFVGEGGGDGDRDGTTADETPAAKDGLAATIGEAAAAKRQRARGSRKGGKEPRR